MRMCERKATCNYKCKKVFILLEAASEHSSCRVWLPALNVRFS